MILSLMSHKEARRGMAYWKEKHQPIFNIIRFGGGGYRRHQLVFSVTKNFIRSERLWD